VTLITLALLLAGSALAGPETIIRERAKELANQNNVSQGVAAPVASTAASAPAAGAPLTPRQQAVARLQSDLAAIKAGSTVAPAQLQQLARDLMADALSAGKPSPELVSKLAADLSGTLSQCALSATDRTRLLSDIDAALNPANIQTAQMTAIIADVQAILQANTVGRKDAVTVASDVKAVAADIQKSSR